jgi:glutamine amidotransferase
MQSVALIDYGSGNLRSAEKALAEAAHRAGVAARVSITADPEVIRTADRVVLPGVGAFAACRRGLDASGLRPAMEEAVRQRGVPFLGICVGMQLLASRGLEFGVTQGLDWIAGDVAVLKPADPAAKIPHMGWNALKDVIDHPLFAGLPADPEVYFTHSFAFTPSNPADIAATVDHGGRFPAAVARDNLAGVQFHPEKSQAAGLTLLANFLEWRP